MRDIAHLASPRIEATPLIEYSQGGLKPRLSLVIWWDQQHIIGCQEAKGADMEVWHLRYSHDFCSSSWCSFEFDIPTKLKDPKEVVITGVGTCQGGDIELWLVAMEPRDTVMSCRLCVCLQKFSFHFNIMCMLGVACFSQIQKASFKGKGEQACRGRGDVNKTIQIEHEMNKTLSTGLEYKYEWVMQLVIYEGEMSHLMSVAVVCNFTEKDMCWASILSCQWFVLFWRKHFSTDITLTYNMAGILTILKST